MDAQTQHRQRGASSGTPGPLINRNASTGFGELWDGPGSLSYPRVPRQINTVCSSMTGGGLKPQMWCGHGVQGLLQLRQPTLYRRAKASPLPKGFCLLGCLRRVPFHLHPARGLLSRVGVTGEGERQKLFLPFPAQLIIPYLASPNSAEDPNRRTRPHMVSCYKMRQVCQAGWDVARGAVQLETD